MNCIVLLYEIYQHIPNYFLEMFRRKNIFLVGKINIYYYLDTKITLQPFEVLIHSYV